MNEAVTEESGYSVTLKGDGSYGSPWIVIRSSDEEDLTDKLQALKEGNTLELVAELAKTFKGLFVDEVKGRPRSRREDDDEDDEDERPTRRRGTTSRSFSRGGSFSGRSRRDDDDEVVEHPEGEGCKHGTYVRRSGKAKNGRRWVGWFCPEGNRSCDPIWEDD